jgi:hypothetical protein
MKIERSVNSTLRAAYCALREFARPEAAAQDNRGRSFDSATPDDNGIDELAQGAVAESVGRTTPVTEIEGRAARRRSSLGIRTAALVATAALGIAGAVYYFGGTTNELSVVEATGADPTAGGSEPSRAGSNFRSVDEIAAVCSSPTSSQTDAVVELLTPLDALMNDAGEWVYVSSLAVDEAASFDQFFPDADARSVWLSGVELVKEAPSPLVVGAGFATGERPVAFFGTTADESVLALEEGSRVMVGLSRLVFREGEAQVGLAPEDGDEVQFVLSAVAVDANGELRELGTCGGDYLVGFLNEFASADSQGRTAHDLLLGILSGDETVVEQLTPALTATSWYDLPPSERNIDVEQTPPEVLERFATAYVQVSVPEAWLEKGGEAICTYTPEGWGPCVVLRPGRTLPLILEVLYQPGTGDGVSIVIRRGTGSTYDQTAPTQIEESLLAAAAQDNDLVGAPILVLGLDEVADRLTYAVTEE